MFFLFQTISGNSGRVANITQTPGMQMQVLPVLSRHTKMLQYIIHVERTHDKRELIIYNHRSLGGDIMCYWPIKQQYLPPNREDCQFLC